MNGHRRVAVCSRDSSSKGDFQGKTWRETGNGNVHNVKYAQGQLNVGELMLRQEELDPVPDLRERRRIAYFKEVGSEKPFKVEKPQPWQQVEQTTWTKEKFIIRDESGKIKCLSPHVEPDVIEEETRNDEVEKDEEIARLLGHISSA